MQKSFESNNENEGTIGEGMIRMLHLPSSTHLKELVDADSHTLFKSIPCCSNFLKQNPTNWSQMLILELLRI